MSEPGDFKRFCRAGGVIAGAAAIWAQVMGPWVGTGVAAIMDSLLVTVERVDLSSEHLARESFIFKVAST